MAAHQVTLASPYLLRFLVLAVDINPRAVAAARENAAHNGVANRVEVRESDAFGAVTAPSM